VDKNFVPTQWGDSFGVPYGTTHPAPCATHIHPRTRCNYRNNRDKYNICVACLGFNLSPSACATQPLTRINGTVNPRFMLHPLVSPCFRICTEKMLFNSKVPHFSYLINLINNQLIVHTLNILNNTKHPFINYEKVGFLLQLGSCL